MHIDDDSAAMIFVLCIIVIFIGAMLFSGSTFGARCAKAYPDDPVLQERCVMRAKAGGPIYEENASYKYEAK